VTVAPNINLCKKGRKKGFTAAEGGRDLPSWGEGEKEIDRGRGFSGQGFVEGEIGCSK